MERASRVPESANSLEALRTYGKNLSMNCINERTTKKGLTFFSMVFCLMVFACKEEDEVPPEASFTFVIVNPGTLPAIVNFSSTSQRAANVYWDFGNGTTSTDQNPQATFQDAGKYDVKLVVKNEGGSDSSSQVVTIVLPKPKADFTITLSNPEVLPVTVEVFNTSIGSNLTYQWLIKNESSTQVNTSASFNAGGIYNIKLVASNESGIDSVTKQVRVSPYPQKYTYFNGTVSNLFAWEGKKVVLLSRNNNLNRAAMFKWVHAVDSTYGYYKACTGKEPVPLPNTYVNNRTTIADVAATCGAGCGHLGATGIEMQSTYFDINYSTIVNTNTFDHLAFYEFGRNFWFYGAKLDYKEPGSFPIAGAYAVWMGSMEGRDAIGVPGSTVYGETYPQAQARFANFLNLYLADPSLNWANTLAVDKGVPGQCNAADLFTSMCMRLKKDYGGDAFLKNIWKNVDLRPNALTTQDAVDNFFLASCATADKNLTTLFQSWRWPLSTNALVAASKYP